MKLLIKDRRQAPRIWFYEDVWYKNIKSDEAKETEYHLGTGKNISEFGICIRSQHRLDTGDTISLKFNFKGKNITALAEVKWERFLMHSGIFEIGMEFKHIKDDVSEAFKKAIYETLYEETKKEIQ